MKTISKQKLLGSILIIFLIAAVFTMTACGALATTAENGESVPATENTTETATGNETGTEGGDATEQTANQYVVTFVTDEHVTVTVYDTQDITGTGTETDTAYARNGETGAVATDGTGQVNFVLTFDDGYEIASLEDAPSDNRKNVKVDPEADGSENYYRITKITGDLTVTISSKAAEEEEDLTQGYRVSFVTDEHVTVTVYKTQDLTAEGETTDVAYSRDSATGLLTQTGGQVNFVVNVDDGYEIASIDVAGEYKNLKNDPEADGSADYYRVTKIAGELTVTIATQTK